MLERVHAAINRIANRWTLLAFGVVAVTTVATVNLADLTWTLPAFVRLTGGVGILDLEWHYTADAAYRILSGQGEAGRAFYWRILWTVDVVIPITVSLWLAIMITLGLRRVAAPDSRWRHLNLLPLAAGVADVLENTAIAIMLWSYPQRLDLLATIAGYVTTAKHLLYQSGLAIALLTALAAAWRGYRDRTRRPATD